MFYDMKPKTGTHAEIDAGTWKSSFAGASRVKLHTESFISFEFWFHGVSATVCNNDISKWLNSFNCSFRNYMLSCVD